MAGIALSIENSFTFEFVSILDSSPYPFEAMVRK